MTSHRPPAGAAGGRLGRDLAELLRPRDRLNPALALPGLLLWTAVVVLAGPKAALFDNDSWMHVVRLIEIVERGAWLNGMTLRDGAPAGYALHWTMPFDLMVAAMAAPLAWSRGWEGAIVAAAPYAGMATGALLIVAAAWAVAPIGRPAVTVFTTLLCATAVPVFNYGQLGICDHHLLIEAVSVAACGAAWRMTGPQGGARAGALAGLLGGLGLWVALEAAPGTMTAAAMATVLAVLSPERHRRAVKAYSLVLTAATAVFLAIDRPADPATTDRLGPVVALLAVLAAAVPLVAVARPVAGLPLRRRLWVTAAAGVLAATLWLAAYALCRRLSPGFTDPQAAAWFWQHIQEFTSVAEAGPAQSIMFLGLPLLAACTAALLSLSDSGGRRLLWAAAFLLMLGLLAGGALYARMALHAAIPAAIILAVALARFMDRPAPVALRALRPLAVIAAAVFPVAAGLLLGPDPPPAERCDAAAAAEVLEAAGPATVLADLNLSAPLLYHTRRISTVSGPYHVNAEAMTDLFHFGQATPEEARAIAGRRRAGFVLICTDGGMPEGGFRTRLTEGDLPPWLAAIPLATTERSAGLRLFRVVP